MVSTTRIQESHSTSILSLAGSSELSDADDCSTAQHASKLNTIHMSATKSRDIIYLNFGVSLHAHPPKMADDAANTEEQLTQEDTTETQAEQPSEKVEDTEKQDDTAASTSNEQNEGAASQNVEGQDQSADIDKDKMEGANSLKFIKCVCT